MTAEHTKSLGVMGALAIGILLYGIGKLDGKASRDDTARDHATAGAQQLARDWKVKYQAAKDDSVDREKIIAVLHRAAQAERSAADSFADQRNAILPLLPQLFTTRDSLRVMVRVVQLDAQEIGRLRAAVDRVSEEADSLRAALVAAQRWRALADAANVTIDSLGKALSDEHHARRCRIGIGVLSVPCPSRKASAVVGVAGGMVLAVLLKR